MMRRPLRLALVLTLAFALFVPARATFASTLSFTDVPTSYWDYTAITYVATTNTWMQDYGTSTFKPRDYEGRKYLARTLVKVYAPSEPIDPNITIPDLPKTDPFYPFANVAIKLGWMPKFKSGKWAPDGSMQTQYFDKAIVLAMKLTGPVNGFTNLHMANGTKYTMLENTPYMEVARSMYLHFNHPYTPVFHEDMELEFNELIKRDEVAYSLWEAKVYYTSHITNTNRLSTISLPTLDPANANQKSQIDVTTYAVRMIGYPYIYAAEWNAATTMPPFCCGTQPKGGFDCSGYVWWIMKKNENNYNAAQYRPYAGWSLLQRASYQMAPIGTHYSYSQLLPGDLMFFTSVIGGAVDHVSIYLGNNWMINSSGYGVVVDYVGTGTWWNDHFLWGRRLIGVAADQAGQGSSDVTVGDKAVRDPGTRFRP